MSGRPRIQEVADGGVRSFCLDPDERQLVVGMFGSGISESVLDLVLGNVTENGSPERSVVADRLRGRGLIMGGPGGEQEPSRELSELLACLAAPTLTAAVMVEAGAFELSLILAGPEGLAVLTKSGDALEVRLIASDLLIAVVAKLTGLHGPQAEGSQRPGRLVAELSPDCLDLESGSVSADVDEVLSTAIDGHPRLRSVAISRRSPDGIRHSEVTWMVDDSNRVLRLHSTGKVMQVMTSGPDEIVALVVAEVTEQPSD